MTSPADQMDRAADRIVEDSPVTVEGQPTSSKTVQGLVGLVPVRAEEESSRASALPLWTFHLAGKHDQASHGRMGGASFDRRIGAAAHDGAAIDAAPKKFEDGDAELDNSLNYYAQAGYLGINGNLRAGKGDDPRTKDHIAAIDKGMRSSALTSDIRVTRGIKQQRKVFGDAWNDTDVTGLEWRDDGFSSTTANSANAGRNFFSGGDGVLMNLYVRKGTKAISVGNREVGEMEILLNRGLKFRVVRDNGTRDGLRRLDVEVRQ